MATSAFQNMVSNLIQPGMIDLFISRINLGNTLFLNTEERGDGIGVRPFMTQGSTNVNECLPKRMRYLRSTYSELVA